MGFRPWNSNLKTKERKFTALSWLEITFCQSCTRNTDPRTNHPFISISLNLNLPSEDICSDWDRLQYFPTHCPYNYISGLCFLCTHAKVEKLKDISWLNPRRETSKDSCPDAPPPLSLLSSPCLSITDKLLTPLSPLPAPPLQTPHIPSPSVLCPYKGVVLFSRLSNSFNPANGSSL